MGNNILITGAGGFIGGFLVEEAIKRKYQVFAGIRSTSSKKYLTDPGIHFLELNYNDPASLDITLNTIADKYGGFDYIIHNAGLIKAKSNADYFLVNFENTKKLVDALKRNNLTPHKFIYISSLAAFGPGEGSNPITEHQIQKPITAYGLSKLKSEQLLYATRGFPFLIINSTAVYGPREKGFLLPLKLIEKHLEFYISSPKQLLSFVHVEDFCKAVFLTIVSSAINRRFLVSDLNVYTPKIFNLIGKTMLNKKTIQINIPPSLAWILASFSEILGRITKKASVLNRERLKEFKSLNWKADCSEIIKLGYKPQFNLEEGLKQTIQWYQEQGWLKN